MFYAANGLIFQFFTYFHSHLDTLYKNEEYVLKENNFGFRGGGTTEPRFAFNRNIRFDINQDVFICFIKFNRGVYKDRDLQCGFIIKYKIKMKFALCGQDLSLNLRFYW